MKIDKSRILNAKAYLKNIPSGGVVRIVTNLTPELKLKLAGLGFPEALSNGDTILPPAVGPTSRFNAEGKFIIHRDQPKESRYVRTMMWRWKEWRGPDTVEKEEARDVWKDCYPRTFVAPPALEISFVESTDSEFAVVAAQLRNDIAHLETITHAINLMLELFGECEIVQEDLSQYTAPAINRVNWQMLPPGRQPWAALRAHLEQTLAKKSDDDKRIIIDRQAFVNSLQPDEIFVGLGGFDGYVAYVFNKYGLVVLESVSWGNAIYVLGEDWQTVARMSKAEVLQDERHVARIIHAKSWKAALARLLFSSQAAE